MLQIDTELEWDLAITPEEDETVDALEDGENAREGAFPDLGWFSRPKEFVSQPYFIQPDLSIVNAADATPDPSLASQAVTLTLDRIRVAQLTDRNRTLAFNLRVTAEHTDDGATSDVSYLRQFRAIPDATLAFSGIQPFEGLRIGAKSLPISVEFSKTESEVSKTALEMLEDTDITRTLNLAGLVHPAIAPLSKVGVGIFKSILKQNKSKKILSGDYEFHLGGDTALARPKLASGTYALILLESGERLDVSGLSFDRHSQAIVENGNEIIRNYLLFSVTKE